MDGVSAAVSVKGKHLFVAINMKYTVAVELGQ